MLTARARHGRRINKKLNPRRINQMESDITDRTTTFSLVVSAILDDNNGSEEESGSDSDDPIWHLEFVFSANINGIPITISFTSWEPYNVSFAGWKTLADGGDIHIHIYQGNGDGWIVQHNGVVTFKSYTSRGGGNATLEWTIPNAVIAAPLNDALDIAFSRGWFH